MFARSTRRKESPVLKPSDAAAAQAASPQSCIDAHEAARNGSSIERRLGEERRRLEREAGVASRERRHFRRLEEVPFTARQRGHMTLLFGGLTWKHDRLIHGGLEGLGYRCEALPVPDVRAFQLGKEFGNNGQCNPTYFTVGNLIQHLQRLECGGESRKEILDRYVFFTAGACGPCRFGMYEAEYRLALRNAGFEGFRILLFQQSAGLKQAEIEAGLALDIDFFMAILNALAIGDLMNEVAYQIRPYEIEPGETDRILASVMGGLHEVMRSRRPHRMEGRLARAAAAVPGMAARLGSLLPFLDQLMGDDLVGALRAARAKLDHVRVDRLRVKPIVKVTGEFWAQTTEGDGNFNMFSFLERENAQVLVEPVATWICYLLHGAANKIRDRKGLEEAEIPPRWSDPLRRIRIEGRAARKIRRLALARLLLKREYERYRKALGGTAHALADQLELERIAHPFYNSRAGGGEGHLEVAKNVYYHNHDLCHMVLSLKPFGCMPSTQSDGVQSMIVSRYPEMIYLPVETSGEGEINAHSRVQMALGEARAKARAEFERALGASGRTVEEIRTFVAAQPDLQRAILEIPHRKGYTGVAANFVLLVADRMRAAGVAPSSRTARRQAAREAAERTEAVALPAAGVGA